jgi:hypothetical protein
MTTSLRTKFAHRENRDGTFDSICRACFLTVATSRSEADLIGFERGHFCDPWDLERLKLTHEEDGNCSPASRR